MKTATDHTAEAARHFTAAADSYDRCQEDGFVSQWAHNINGRLSQAKAEIAAADGKSEFLGLFRIADGSRVRTKIISTKFGICWAVCDAANQFTGEFIPVTPAPGKKSRKQTALGYEERPEMAPAAAEISASGTGLAGAASAYVRTYRTDGGYPADAR